MALNLRGDLLSQNRTKQNRIMKKKEVIKIGEKIIYMYMKRGSSRLIYTAGENIIQFISILHCGSTGKRNVRELQMLKVVSIVWIIMKTCGEICRNINNKRL